MDEETQDETPICGRCNGSGEGMRDGARCLRCGGTGSEPRRDEDEDWERDEREPDDWGAHWEGEP